MACHRSREGGAGDSPAYFFLEQKCVFLLWVDNKYLLTAKIHTFFSDGNHGSVVNPRINIHSWSQAADSSAWSLNIDLVDSDCVDANQDFSCSQNRTLRNTKSLSNIFALDNILPIINQEKPNLEHRRPVNALLFTWPHGIYPIPLDLDDFALAFRTSG